MRGVASRLLRIWYRVIGSWPPLCFPSVPGPYVPPTSEWAHFRPATEPRYFLCPRKVAREMRALFTWLKRKKHLRCRSTTGFATDAEHFLLEINARRPFDLD